MAFLELIQLGNPVLRSKSRKLNIDEIHSDEIQTVITDMFQTCIEAQGVGLAAPQIGQNFQLAVIDIHPTEYRPDLKQHIKTVIINPRIVEHSQEIQTGWEGCLSFNTVRGKVERWQSITVDYFDEQGKQHIETINDFAAVVFQHEIDHLHGTVFVDRMKNMSSLMTIEEYMKREV
jgi:peptide deformylase